MGAHPVPPSDANDPWIGRILGDTYRIEAHLGAGAMGTVYRARHRLLDQDFAVKVLASALADDPDVRRRFLLEARTLALFSHRHAVQVRHCGEEGGALYLVMDLVEGETLESLLAREGRLAPARARRLTLEVLGALDEAHRAGIVHRDVKPGNVMVERARGPDGSAVEVARVLDFGLARIVDPTRTPMPDAFASLGGTVVGTVAYMAPEQLRAEDDVDGRADVFAVGVLLHEMLAGATPFPGASTLSIAMRIAEGEPEPLPPIVAESVPAGLRRAIRRALSRRPDDRFPTAGAFAEALRATEGEPLAEGGGVPSRSAVTPAPPLPTGGAAPASPSRRASDRTAPPAPPASSTSTAPHARRRLALGIAAGTVAAILAVGSLAGWWGGGRHASDGAARRREATEALDEGRFSAAVEAYGLVLAESPGDVEALLGRARARIGLLDVNARADVDEALRVSRDDPRVLLERARYHARVEKDSKAADPWFAKALAADPTSVEAHAERARVRIGEGALSAAEIDVAAIEKDAPRDARGPVLRSLIEAGRVTTVPTTPEGEAAIARAIAAGRAATALDPRLAEAAHALSNALLTAARHASAAGRYDEARLRNDEAEAAASDALARARATPGYRGQGGTVVALLRTRAGVRLVRGDEAGALVDYDEAVRLAPKDPETLSLRAYAEQQLGHQEEAIRDFGLLYGITLDPDALFRQAFGWQRIGEGRADQGDVDGALKAYAEALALYDAGAARHPEAVSMRLYGGEVRGLRARLRSGEERAEDLRAARTALDAALSTKSATAETLLRRGEVRLLAGDTVGALEDLRAAVGDRKDATPRYYGRFARAAVERSREELAAGRRAESAAFASEAVEASERAIGLRPDLARFVRPVLATAHVRVAAAAGTPEAKDAALRRADDVLAAHEREPGTEEGEAARAKATAAYVRAERLLVAGDAVAALAQAELAVATRDAEADAKRWIRDGAWWDRLADARAAAGDGAGATEARARARTLPR